MCLCGTVEFQFWQRWPELEVDTVPTYLTPGPWHTVDSISSSCCPVLGPRSSTGNKSISLSFSLFSWYSHHTWKQEKSLHCSLTTKEQYVVSFFFLQKVSVCYTLDRSTGLLGALRKKKFKFFVIQFLGGQKYLDTAHRSINQKEFLTMNCCPFFYAINSGDQVIREWGNSESGQRRKKTRHIFEGFPKACCWARVGWRK